MERVLLCGAVPVQSFMPGSVPEGAGPSKAAGYKRITLRTFLSTKLPASAVLILRQVSLLDELNL